jgi:RNA polymerase sigma factor (sigma-70 family)
MHNPLFDKPEADAIILGGKEIGTRTRAQEVLGKARRSDEGPLHLKELKKRKLLTREQEVDLFRRYNFLKYRISELRETLRSSEPSARLIQQIKALQAQADRCRETMVSSNLGLVISIARKHLWGGSDFETLVADGNLSLMQAVEKFDYSRGNRFSTYASWAIMKNYAKNIPEERYHLHTFYTGASELLEQLDARSVSGPGQVALKRSISKLLARLEDREKQVIASRFGLTDGTARETLAEVGKRLSLSKERVRQIERQALEKLRKILEG